MPHAHPAAMSNLEAIAIGFGLKGDFELYFIIECSYENTYRNRVDLNKLFKLCFFVGTYESCKRNLIDYPNCKII